MKDRSLAFAREETSYIFSLYCQLFSPVGKANVEIKKKRKTKGVHVLYIYSPNPDVYVRCGYKRFQPKLTVFLFRFEAFPFFFLDKYRERNRSPCYCSLSSYTRSRISAVYLFSLFISSLFCFSVWKRNKKARREKTKIEEKKKERQAHFQSISPPFLFSSLERDLRFQHF